MYVLINIYIFINLILNFQKDGIDCYSNFFLDNFLEFYIFNFLEFYYCNFLEFFNCNVCRKLSNENLYDNIGVFKDRQLQLYNNLLIEILFKQYFSFLGYLFL